jgi:methyltransferase, FkbM family
MNNNAMLDVTTATAARANAFCEAFLRSAGRPRYLFGRNQYSRSIAAQVAVDGFIDDFTNETTYCGRPVVSLEAVPTDALVVNCVPVGRPLTAQRRIQTAGHEQLDYFAFLRHSGLDLQPIEYWTGFEAHFEAARDRYDALAARLRDPLSREILARIVAFRLSYDLDHMRPFADCQARQYFESFLPHRPGEVFADIGAFDGVTSEEFARRWPDYRAIYLFEPDAGNLATAKVRLRGDPRVKLEPYAVGERRAIARFGSAGSSSRISDAGETEVQVVPLDDYLEVGFTFLKLDVEGSEAGAIAGARKVIETHHPKIAASVYHRPADLVDIPEQVLAIRPDYEVALRHYTEGFTETVMYFLPKP